MSPVNLLGLTGGIGSGKSTVAAMLADHGAAVVDADAIARGVTAAGGAAIAAIAQAFGAELITPQGALDRDRMRALVFADPDARRRLEAIVHPLVSQETERQAQAAIAQGHRTVVFDVPLLVESGRRWRQKVQRVLVVDCAVATQVERVMARSGLAQPQVERIVASQASRAQRLAAADIVIHNQGLSLPALGEEVRQVVERYGL